ncbi:MAG: dynamin family protein [Deltaproteobacteria bacterium]|nr:MAG: dynamin family protein [Deltaproteobacteria bacterium]
MNEKELHKHLQSKVRKKLEPLFSKFNMDFGGIDAALKWKPLVLVIGNYSSGKSTLINELLGQEIQRTGQAPTDDSFTIITSDVGYEGVETPGSTVVNDPNLPFQQFRDFGEKLISHISMKQVDSPVVENMAIIDSPGMLDATSEKDRGYDYMKVLGEFAKMADLIVLMFDPHKAGTIKETYHAIRNTLPEKSGEHRIVFVMSRIDECDNLSDFTRSYGTLCWNMSQMTGRKDIPHIYLTYAPDAVEPGEVAEDWPQEREQLLEKIKKATSFRINHLLEDVDRQVNELEIVAESVSGFLQRVSRVYWKYTNISLVAAVVLFFFGDVVLNAVSGYPEKTMLASVRNGSFSMSVFMLPALFALIAIAVGSIGYSRVAFRKMKKKALSDGSQFLQLETAYRKKLWEKMKDTATKNLEALGPYDFCSGYARSLTKIRKFLKNDLKKYYEKAIS